MGLGGPKQQDGTRMYLEFQAAADDVIDDVINAYHV
jgi:hypothetical protein